MTNNSTLQEVRRSELTARSSFPATPEDALLLFAEEAVKNPSISHAYDSRVEERMLKRLKEEDPFRAIQEKRAKGLLTVVQPEVLTQARVLVEGLYVYHRSKFKGRSPEVNGKAGALGNISANGIKSPQEDNQTADLKSNPVRVLNSFPATIPNETVPKPPRSDSSDPISPRCNNTSISPHSSTPAALNHDKTSVNSLFEKQGKTLTKLSKLLETETHSKQLEWDDADFPLELQPSKKQSVPTNSPQGDIKKATYTGLRITVPSVSPVDGAEKVSRRRSVWTQDLEDRMLLLLNNGNSYREIQEDPFFYSRNILNTHLKDKVRNMIKYQKIVYDEKTKTLKRIRE